MDSITEQRLDSVEAALAEFIIQNNRGFHQLRREMAEFKNEMAEFKNEMAEFKNEMGEFKEEMRANTRDMNKKWGELANKLGTVVEDIIAPAVRPVVKKYFGEEITDIMVNRRKYDKNANLKGEFDVIAVGSRAVYLLETKLSPNKEKLMEFKNRATKNFRQLFPEYDHLTLIPIFSSLRFDDKFVDLATKEKIYLMAYREWEYMDILNFEEVSGG